MLTSAFTPFGQLRFSSRAARGASIYRALKSATRGAYAKDGHADASLFARAMALGRVSAAIERAENQNLPARVTDMLPAYEEEYGITPPPGASLDARRAVLAERVKRPGGASRAEVERALARALGRDFVAYRTARPKSYPPSPESGPGLFLSPYAVQKIGRLTAPVVGVFAADGTPLPVAMHLAPVPGLEACFSFVPGDPVVVSPDHGSQAELLVLASPGPALDTGLTPLTGGHPAAQAPDGRVGPPPAASTFLVYASGGHAAGDVVATQRWPYWIGQSRHALVVVNDRAVRDPHVHAAVDGILRERSRATSTWEVVSRLSFVLGHDRLGACALSDV